MKVLTVFYLTMPADGVLSHEVTVLSVLNVLHGYRMSSSEASRDERFPMLPSQLYGRRYVAGDLPLLVAKESLMKAFDVLALILVIVGALNWGLVGAFKFNLVTALFGATALSAIVFVLVGLAGIFLAIRLSTARAQLGVVPA
jgi:uncharacterized protein